MEHPQTEKIATTLGDLATPCLILDADRMEQNIARLRARPDRLGVALRPHLKTAKSVGVARRVMSSPAGHQGYGLVCDITGKPYADLIMADANEEHGIITVRPGSNARLPEPAIGDRVRILPNHACATGAQHPAYQVVRGASGKVEAEWPRSGGWK